MKHKSNKSVLRLSKTTLPVRCTLAFSELCRKQSEYYPAKLGPKLSSARFLKQAAIEKLLKIGFDEEYIKSIT